MIRILEVPIFEGDIIKIRYKKFLQPEKEYIGWVISPNWVSKIFKIDLVLEVIPKEIYIDFKSYKVKQIEVLSRKQQSK